MNTKTEIGSSFVLRICYVAFIFCALMFASTAMAAGHDAIVASAGWVGVASAILAIVLQIAKSPILGSIFAKIDPGYQAAVVLVIGQAIALVDLVISGGDWKTAAISWLFVSGGAMVLYSVFIKPFLKKKSE